ncbi:anti-sigma-F factor Fin family protein [Sporosarcina sp. ANT_H38]|uniref:anti-sigma-F factor Fin n=1 Tax=Sporosarcina sp. ANT_H38 TaxID=2597358 RepID=UPI0011F358BF|nr:anti-sigma-F factor Fin [Sporosarcina sp. ANT_H38]KAA0941013.1 anti-sigma-F factor Fin family protein [Sporosarcina sp. ANT_H38]
MAIRYTCRHCETEIGTLPFESAKETVLLLHQMNEAEAEHFLAYEKDGALTVRCICEQCEQSLQRFPDYYALNKWLQ